MVKFFKFLSIMFAVYICLISIGLFIVEFSNTAQLPPKIADSLDVFLILSTVFAIPFTSLLKMFGLFSQGWWSLPTSMGIIVSLLIWEAIFILLFIIFGKFRKSTGYTQ